MVLVFIFIFALNSCTMLTPAETTSKETSVKEQDTKETEATTAKETETTAKESAADQIKVTKPQPNQVVESPLTIEGEALGTWSEIFSMFLYLSPLALQSMIYCDTTGLETKSAAAIFLMLRPDSYSLIISLIFPIRILLLTMYLSPVI